MTMGTRCVFSPDYSKKKPAQDTLVPPLRGKREKNIILSRMICSRCCTRRNLRFTLKLLTRSSKTAHATIALRSRHRINPRLTRFVWARPVNVDDGLEDIRWIRGLGGEKLPAASYALLPNLKERPIFCHRRGIEKFCSPVFYTAAPKRVRVRRLASARHLSPVVL